MLHNAKLGYTIINMHHSIPGGIHGNKPLVIITTVSLVYNTHGIGLDKTEILKGRTSGNYMSFKT